jgi:hypothetical protein
MLNTLSVMSLAAVVSAAAASPIPSTRSTTALPPIGITVVVGPGIAPALVTRILDETDAVWRATGFRFAWVRDTQLPTVLRVTIDNAQGIPIDGATTLGWIHFDERSVPDPDIHLSYANAMDLLRHSVGVVGNAEQMPVAERQLLLGRAMGRALAHEIGHYLLASKAHTDKGLMATRRSAYELFSAERARFAIDAGEQGAMAARFVQPVVTAGNRPGRATR